MFIRRLVFLAIFIALIGVLGIGIRYSPRLDWLIEHELALHERVALHPFASWWVGLLAYFGLSLVPGTAGKSVVCGWLYGFWGSLAMVELGLTGAAIVSFLIGRTLAHELVARKWHQRLRNFGRHFAHDGALYLVQLRVAHAPFTLINYGAGATQIPLLTFSWTTALGILPGSMVFTFVGTRIPSLRSVADHGVWALLDLPLILALLATCTLPLLLRTIFLRWAKRKHNLHNRNAA